MHSQTVSIEYRQYYLWNQDLFGDEDSASVEVRGRHNMISPSNVVSVLPSSYHDVMVSLPQLEANNAYNRLITAIEIVESTEQEPKQ